MSTKKSKLVAFAFVLILGIAFAAIGGFLTYESYSLTTNAEETVGVVEDTWIDSETETRRRDGERRTETYYYPMVNYTYEVDGEEHNNDNLEPGGRRGHSSRSSAEEVLEDFEEGEEVTVYYNPENPGESFLIPTRFPLVPLIFFILGVLMVIGSFYFLLRKKKEREVPDLLK